MTTPLPVVVGAIMLLGPGCADTGPGSSQPSVMPDAPTVLSPLKNVEFLEQYAATRGFTHGTPKSIAITPDGSVVFFLRSGPRSFVQDLFAVDTASGEEHVFLTADKILAGGEEKLTAEELARRERMRLASRGIASFLVSKDGKRVLVPLSGRLFVVERNGAVPGAITELKSDKGYPIDPQFSPDGTKVACVRDGDLYVLDIATGAETRLTTKKSDTESNGLAEFVAQEEMDRFHGFWWSPDSKQIAYEQADTAGMEVFHIADAVNPGAEAQSWPYPRPGRANAKVRLGVIASAGGETRWLEWDRDKNEYLGGVFWGKSQPLCVTVMTRDQSEVSLFVDAPDPGDAASKVMRKVAADGDPAWVNLSSSAPIWRKAGAPPLRMKEDDDLSLWVWQEHRGEQPRRLTPPGFGLQGFVGLDKQKAIGYVLASPDPTQSHLFAVPLEGSSTPTRITIQDGVYGITIAEDADVAVTSGSLLNGNIFWMINDDRGPRTDGAKLRLTREEPPWIPHLTLETAGSRDFHTALIRPRDFDPAKKYPVIVNVYGGPHHQMVRASPQLYYLQQWIADQGFIIAMIDGRGTPNRGRDWERAIKNDLINVALEDQVDALQALGKKHPEMDLSRTGIYGWSFGGYFSAMAVMKRPDVFHAGCAGAPVCDWLDYDTCYTERYLGVPPPAGDEKTAEIYRKNSVLTYCKDLTRPLLIIHGTSDDNVYFMHSLKMTQELFRQGKEFEFLPLAGFTHMVPDPVVTTRLYSRIATFFKEKLGEPKTR